jgi:hypothetical protein
MGILDQLADLLNLLFGTSMVYATSTIDELSEKKIPSN